MATKKKEVEIKEIEAAPEGPVKYRSDFKSWDEYNKYTGLKG